MDKLHETNIEDLYDYLREEKELAESTIVKIHADILKPVFKTCCQVSYSPPQPADIEDPPKHGKPQINVWNQEEMNAFLDAAKGDWMYPVFHLSLNTGMRIGEVLGLQWKHVDFDKKLIYVRQSLTAKTRELTSPKTESSIRDVPFDDITSKILKNQKSAINEKKLRAGSSYNDQDFVFVSGEGAPLLQSNVRRKFNSLIKKAGVPKIRIHDMRHTWATLQLMTGTDIKTVSSILGHSSVWFTYDTYAHVLPEMQKLAVENQLQIIQRKT
ncbi:hypothetical protein GCM10010965_12550 [Caldalkalibacillus thermarum]|nr:hypothetical protein GCM10010965_12550 [Caldalkalibacillus thermarum]